MAETNRFGLTDLPDEKVYIDYNIESKYPYKWINVYEEDNIGKVCYYVLQADTPKKVVARHIFNDNPQIQKVYMALRDWVSYDLIQDLEKGRKVIVYTRAEMSEKPKEKVKVEEEMLERSKWPIFSGTDIDNIVRCYKNGDYSKLCYLKIAEDELKISTRRGPIIYIQGYSKSSIDMSCYRFKLSKNRIIYVTVDGFNKYYADVDALPKKYFEY